MSATSDLIERMERETGQRVDANGGNNMAIAGLFGALSREMEKSPASYTQKDDVAAGLLIKHQMSPAGQREEAGKDMLADLLIGGMSPDAVKALLG